MRNTRRFFFLVVLGCATLLAGHGLPAPAQPLTAWVARYSGITGPNSDDYAYDLAVDASGNVYVTGQSAGFNFNFDYATIKYDASGAPAWIRRYNGPENSRDAAIALAIDSAGNVYVTGTSGSDYATIKYDADGNQLWVARYNAGASGPLGGARALAVDSSGNVYVTGSSDGSSTSFDYATIKYDTHGNMLWIARYNGPGNTRDSARAVAIDNAGNVYVTGTTGTQPISGQGGDYATIKYDADGNQLWVARYNGPSISSPFGESARDIAVDNSGNVYVTGFSDATGTGFRGYDYATIKYDADGNEIWVARYNGPGNGLDEPSALALDGTGNVYVTGESTGAGTATDYATIKYDADGNELWVARYNGPRTGEPQNTDRARALALDSAGNVYVTGESWGLPSTGLNYVTVKYHAGGGQLWVARYTGGFFDIPSAIALDAGGNVYVTGQSRLVGMGYQDYATIKYAATPNLRLSVTDSRRTEDGAGITLRLDNAGDADATRVQIASATLADVEADGLPQGLPDIPANGSATAMLRFAGSFTPGARALLRVQGSFNGGTFTASRLVTVP